MGITTFSPLEQFEIHLPFYSFGLVITNLICFFLLSASFFLYASNNLSYVFSNALSFFMINFFNFILVFSKMNKKSPEFFIIFYYLFALLLLNNSMGMMPFSYTTTSSAVIAFFFSIGVFTAIVWMGLDYSEDSFLNLFLPSGAPSRMIKLLVFIETVSYFMRVVSLGVRLLANMISGHSLLKILSGFAWGFLSIKLLYNILFLFAWSIIMFVTTVEVLISFLQAFVFTFLVSMYLNDSLTGH